MTIDFTGEFEIKHGTAQNIQRNLTQDIPITNFELDGRIVELITPTPAIINEGDEILVAGYKEGNILRSNEVNSSYFYIIGTYIFICWN